MLKFPRFLKQNNASAVDTFVIARHLGVVGFVSGVTGLSLGDFR